jgi:hypothetical protein
MWLHHDLGWWGFWVGLLALVVAIIGIPLAIIAPIIAPRLENWWAERSVASTKKRIASLVEKLAEYERIYPELSLTEDYVLRGIRGIGIMLMICVQLLSIITLFIALLDVRYIPRNKDSLIIAIGLLITGTLGAVAGHIMDTQIFKRIETYRIRRSRPYRDSLKDSIKQLQARLEGDNA